MTRWQDILADECDEDEYEELLERLTERERPNHGKKDSEEKRNQPEEAGGRSRP
jgi:translation initiation factor 2 beta subunit (eIF-2beta)/eIF-5